MDPTMIRLLCALLAVVFLGMIVLRRRKKAE
jgi:phage shock protein PspC (stress-responsive transcriptional regulator)